MSDKIRIAVWNITYGYGFIAFLIVVGMVTEVLEFVNPFSYLRDMWRSFKGRVTDVFTNYGVRGCQNSARSKSESMYSPKDCLNT